MRLWHLLLVIALLAATGLAACATGAVAMLKLVLSTATAGLVGVAEAIDVLTVLLWPFLFVLSLLSIALSWHTIGTVVLPQIIVRVLDGFFSPCQ